MRSKKSYFPVDTTAPSNLVASIERRVRFEEVDTLRMVWHGRYPSYLEDGRIAFGDKYGLSYQAFIQHQTAAPVVQMHLDYLLPLRFDELFTIEAALHWTDSARLNFSYRLINDEGQTTAKGYTVQLLTDTRGEMLLIVPEWIKEFRDRWQAGEWHR
ncbi:acyl-CoA thioesterase [Desulfosediminicola sp.]|uniref:acyl-CoA thioesterase n=1 Tax=Desulfosediminicola sp. TaxID=2886825 RepID=UPI003AF2395C